MKNIFKLFALLMVINFSNAIGQTTTPKQTEPSNHNPVNTTDPTYQDNPKQEPQRSDSTYRRGVDYNAPDSSGTRKNNTTRNSKNDDGKMRSDSTNRKTNTNTPKN